MAVTALDGAIDDDDVTITVDSTSGFLGADVITIGDEYVAYAGKTDTEFTGCTRGYDISSEDTSEPAGHGDGSEVFTTSASVLNSALNFNVASTAATFGALSVVVLPARFFTHTLPNLIAWNFSFLQGDMAFVAYFFFAVSIGLVVVLALYMIQVAQGIIRRP